MSNHTGKFLTQKQMAEAKRSEAIQNSIQKREGTNFPLSEIIAWGCGCCIGPVINRKSEILSAKEADAVLKAKKKSKKEKKNKTPVAPQIDWEQEMKEWRDKTSGFFSY